MGEHSLSLYVYVTDGEKRVGGKIQQLYKVLNERRLT